MNVGDKVQMSQLHENDVGLLDGQMFIVVDRYPEDRASGGTEIQYRNSSKRSFVWDNNNPDVMYIGKGRIVQTIEWPA